MQGPDGDPRGRMFEFSPTVGEKLRNDLQNLRVFEHAGFTRCGTSANAWCSPPMVRLRQAWMKFGQDHPAKEFRPKDVELATRSRITFARDLERDGARGRAWIMRELRKTGVIAAIADGVAIAHDKVYMITFMNALYDIDPLTVVICHNFPSTIDA